MSKLYLQHDYAVTGRDYVETEGGDTPAGGVNYSTEEHVIGKVADKTLYGKTIVINNVAGNSYITEPHGITDLDTVWNIRGVVLYGTGNVAIVGPFIADLSALSYYAGALLEGNNMAVKIGADIAPGTVILELEYQKTE